MAATEVLASGLKWLLKVSRLEGTWSGDCCRRARRAVADFCCCGSGDEGGEKVCDDDERLVLAADKRALSLCCLDEGPTR